MSLDMRLLLVLAFLFSPIAVSAADVDLGIYSGDISFSEELVAGERLRIYATVHNEGEEDVSGYVSFFQGSVPIDDSQVISVRGGGQPEEVYVDFVVPSGSFNIRAELRGTDPADQNSGNDVAITKLFTPIVDDDRDGIENAEDNCVSVDNEDQIDSDGDGEGNACDEDDDNDGLSDDVEDELGSNPIARDSDGDGVADASDAYPTDFTRSVIPPPAPPAQPVQPAPAVAAAEDERTEEEEEVSVISVDTQAPQEDEITEETVAEAITTPPAEEVRYSPNAVFSYQRESWNTFRFIALVPEIAGAQAGWDFGDEVTSNRREVVHTYRSPGDYTVVFYVTNPDGSTAQDQTTVSVPFFTLENRIVIVLIVGLVLLLISALMTAVRISMLSRKKTDVNVGEEDVSDDAQVTEEMPVLESEEPLAEEEAAEDGGEISEADVSEEAEEPVEEDVAGQEEAEEGTKVPVRNADEEPD